MNLSMNRRAVIAQRLACRLKPVHERGNARSQACWCPAFRRSAVAFRMAGRDGAVLASVLIIVLLFGIVGAMILRTGEGVGIETSRAISDAQAFWVAEAGLNHVRALLGKGANGGVAYWTLATNGYAVTVAVDPVIPHTYAAVSTGTVVLARRVVRQRYGTWPQAFSYAMFAGGGELWLKRDAMIEGAGTATGNLYAAGGFTFSMDRSIPTPSSVVRRRGASRRRSFARTSGMS